MPSDVALVLDADAYESDPEIHFSGFFKRRPENSAAHLRELEQDGVLYVGYGDRKKERTLKKKPPQLPEHITISSGEDDDPAATTARMARGAIASGSGTSTAIVVDDSSGESEPPSKRQKTELDASKWHESDMDLELDDTFYESDGSGYSVAHAALNIHEERNWSNLDHLVPKKLPLLNIADKAEQSEALTSQLCSMSLVADSDGYYSNAQPRSRSSTLWTEDISELNGEQFSWIKLRNTRYGRHRRSFHSSIDFQRFSAQYYRGLKPVHSLARAAGAINQIVQCKGIVAVASAATDGGADSQENEEVTTESPYNREGALMVHWDGKDHILADGHRCQRTTHVDGLERIQTKQYTVNDVKFDPTDPTRLVSAGQDCTIREWNLSRVVDGHKPKLARVVKYPCVPNALCFRHTDSLLAISGADGSVYLQRGRAKPQDLLVNEDHMIADMCWGNDSSSDILYASSESQDDEENTGTCRAFDVHTGKSYDFDLEVAGLRLAADPSGSRLVVQSKASEEPPVLHIFDIRRKEPRPSRTVELEDFELSHTGNHFNEINRMVFSSDGLYLAIARSDNSCHVYDSRFLNRVLQQCRHGPSVGVGSSYGVVDAQWIEDRHPLLVTGGADGCVRLWNINQASEGPSDSQVLAECDYDIGHFSVGAMSGRDRPLIVGEMSGAVTIFDHTRTR